MHFVQDLSDRVPRSDDRGPNNGRAEMMSPGDYMLESFASPAEDEVDKKDATREEKDVSRNNLESDPTSASEALPSRIFTTQIPMGGATNRSGSSRTVMRTWLGGKF